MGVMFMIMTMIVNQFIKKLESCCFLIYMFELDNIFKTSYAKKTNETASENYVVDSEFSVKI